MSVNMIYSWTCLLALHAQADMYSVIENLCKMLQLRNAGIAAYTERSVCIDPTLWS